MIFTLSIPNHIAWKKIILLFANAFFFFTSLKFYCFLKRELIVIIISGYRHINLRNECNQPLLLPTLFVHISVKDYVSDIHAGLYRNILPQLFTTLSQFLTILGKNPFENIEEKGENAGNQHFLLFPQCFQAYQIQKSSFNQLPHHAAFCHTKNIWLWKTL